MTNIEIWNLPNLPFTEKLGVFDPKSKGIDQALMIEEETGVLKLKNHISPDILYTHSDYNYRSGTSFKTNKQLINFIKFKNKFVQTKKSIGIDIGGNDLLLAEQMISDFAEIYVIDPVVEESKSDNIISVKKFVENVDLKLINPDVVLSRHTLEHLLDPGELISKLFDECKDDCLHIFEVPDFDCLVESLRFDAVFHQHLYYFNYVTLSNLITRNGGIVLGSEKDYQGSCGGSLYIAFKKRTHQKAEDLIPVSIELEKKKIQKAIENFESQMKILSNGLKNQEGRIYGYGAGLMLASYAYHLKTDLSMLECILDDDPDKDGTGYVNLPCQIRNPTRGEIPADSSFLITSLENIRPIFKRCLEFQPRRVLVPTIS